jgi:pentatricopeptide repeat protein
MWTHNTADGVKSALNTRFVMNPTVKVRFARPLQSIPEKYLSRLLIPLMNVCTISRPIGLHVAEGPNGGVFVTSIRPNGGAERSRAVKVGDQILQMSASWGDRMWDINSVDNFAVGIKSRTGPKLSLKLRRMLTLDEYRDLMVFKRSFRSKDQTSKSNESDGIDIDLLENDGLDNGDILRTTSVIKKVRSIDALEKVWEIVQSRANFEKKRINTYHINLIMTQAIKLEHPKFAIKIFEDTCGYNYVRDEAIELAKIYRPEFENHIARSLEYYSIDPIEGKHLSEEDLITSLNGFDEEFDNEEYSSHASNITSHSDSFQPTMPQIRLAELDREQYLQPNRFICTTALKAYARAPDVSSNGFGMLEWYESCSDESADVYLMSALLYLHSVCKRVDNCEHLFYNEIPKRGIKYTTGLCNTMLFAYVRSQRLEDALKVYNMVEEMDETCDEITYGTLFKGLLESKDKEHQARAFAILKDLPAQGFQCTVGMFNVFLEFYSRTCDFQKIKSIIYMMTKASPRVKPNLQSYEYIINGFALAKKPFSALGAYRLLSRRRYKHMSSIV